MNVFSFSGNLTRDPELRKTQDGKSVCSFTVALNRMNKATFVDCVIWEKGAETLAQYCKKGDRIAGSGRLSNRSWVQEDGQKRYKIEVVVTQFDLPPKQKTEDHQSYDENTDEDEIPF